MGRSVFADRVRPDRLCRDEPPPRPIHRPPRRRPAACRRWDGHAAVLARDAAAHVASTSWPTTRPDLVASLHREYLDAGADLIETTDLRRQPHAPRRVRPRRRASRLNRRAAQVAREARDVTGRARGRRQHRPARRADARAPPRRAVIRAALPRADRGPARGWRRPPRHRDLLRPRRPADRRRRGPPRGGRAGHRADDIRRGGAGRRHHARGRGPALTAAGVDAIGVNCGVGPQVCLDALARSASPRPASRPARSCPTPACPAHRGPVRLRGRAAVVRVDRRPLPRRRRAHHRRLLRHDAGPHPAMRATLDGKPAAAGTMRPHGGSSVGHGCHPAHAPSEAPTASECEPAPPGTP